MYPVSEEYKEQINLMQPHHIKGTLKQGDRAEIDITNMLCGSVSRYGQCTENADIFGIGAVYQGEISFSLQKSVAIDNLYNSEVKLWFGLELLDGTIEWVPLGTYYINSAQKSGKIIHCTALDSMGKLDINAVTPINPNNPKLISYTLKYIIEALPIATGVQFAQTLDEINAISSYPIWQFYGFVNGRNLTWRNLLREVAELLGGFAFINRDGKIEFKRLDNIIPVAEISNRRYNIQLADRNFQPGFLIYNSSSDGTAYTYTSNASGVKIYFTDNGLIDGYIKTDSSRELLSSLFDNIKSIRYNPGEIEYAGNPALDIGDYVRVTEGNANGELMLIGSDNWTFRGKQILISPGLDSTDGSTGASGSGGGSGSSGGASSTLVHLPCDVNTGNISLSQVILDVDFSVSDISTYIQLCSDFILNATSQENADITYFLDDVAINFAPKITVPIGYTTQHLNYITEIESGEHNFRAEMTCENGYIEQINGFLIGQNIKTIQSKPTTETDYIYSIANGEVTLMYYIGTTRRPIIPDTVEGVPVRTIEATCFNYSDVKKAVVPEGVTAIY